MAENNDKIIYDEAEYTDRIRTIGADYLLCNMLVIFGGGAIAAAALRHGSEGRDLAALYLCMSLLVAIHKRRQSSQRVLPRHFQNDREE